MARQKPPFVFEDKTSEKPVLEATAEEVKYHIQIRVDEAGRAKSDGRRGRIILEDLNAPIAVLRWLKSPECRRSTKGKPVYVWCNEHPVPAGGYDTPGDDDDEADDGLPALPAPSLPPGTEAAMQLAAGYQRRVEQITGLLEARLTDAKTHHEAEIARLRAAAQAEVEACDEQIKEARDRLALERAREDEEMEALANRRRAMIDERSAMSDDLRKEIETNRDYRQMLAQNLKKGDTIENLVNAVTKLKENNVDVMGTAMTLLQWLSSKAASGGVTP